MRQWNQAIEEVRAALPTLSRSAEPTAVRSDIRPEFIEVPAQPVRLDLELIEQPAFRLHRAKRKQTERLRLQGSAIRLSGKRNRNYQEESEKKTLHDIQRIYSKAP